ncbi:PREDICTED: probable histone-lysine N-methyltransferase Mes-4 [Rhagoletis zephyria]|uniref:probable histone-lysine N-methyltransferase Mes-4 n=1 Tax=Rhagoletis zephyria TaxID=28612 RepID=UPI00081179FA|nr:PREDICTED: probable histone-lysine N-methyltransferase Mes-4 [Rhagoletis zephyria]
MRADQKQTVAVNRESRRRAAVECEASFGSPVRKVGGVDSFKNNSSQKNKKMSSEKCKLLKSRENSEPRTVTPTAGTASADMEGRRKDASTCIGSNHKLSSSTPRRKRDLLANLYSDLSPKYIGFSTPPSSTAGGNNGSESDGGLQTRSARRRKLLVYADSPDLGGSDSEVLADTSTTLLGCVRRTGNESVTPSPNRLSARKKFESPIDKLLARNGSVVLNDVSKEKIVKSLDVSAEPKLNTINSESAPEPKEECTETQCDELNTNDLTEVAETPQENCQTNSEETECNGFDTIEKAIEEGVNEEVNEDVQDNQEGCKEMIIDTEKKADNSEGSSTETATEVKSKEIPDVQNQLEIYCGSPAKENDNKDQIENTKIPEKSELSEENFLSNQVVVVKIENESFENIAECNSEIVENHTDSADAILQYDAEGGESGESMILNNAVGMSAKSPSAVSLDSAKGSSVVTGMAWMSFTTGDLFWGQIYTYCYWPCIVCPDPDGKTITTERNVRNSEEYVLVHVRFFADSGRRNWVKRENLIPYTDLENYKQHMREVRKKYGKKSAKYRLLLPKPSKVMIWREAIKEANKVAEILYEDRLKKFFEMYEHKKSLQKLQRKQRKLSIDNGSSTSSFRHDSMESLIVKNPLAAGKRDRSASPYSPAFSPLKSVSSIKRRKLSDASNQGEQVSEKIAENNSDVIESSKNASTTQTMDGDANTSSSFTSLHAVELSSSDEYRNFYHAMKEFVLEDNKDEILERSLIVAARNIWALKQINRQQMQRRLLSVSNEQELGSSLVESGSSQGTVKRLSNRLRTMRCRHSLPAKIKAVPQIEILESRPSKDQVVQSVEKPKRPLNRPIEEVIDDIFNLDNKYLFRGLARDPVCKYCLHPGGLLVRCAKGCLSWLHADCIGKNPNVGKKPKSVMGRKYESSKSRRDSAKWSIDTKTSQNIHPDMDQERAGTSLSVISYHVTADADAEPDVDSSIIEKVTDVVCDSCALEKPPICAVCTSDNPSEPSREELVMCNMPHCSKAFHPSCCRYWPQAKFTKSKNKIESFRCPSHVCHTCVSDDPKGKFQHLSNSKLTKCVKCPASYHMDSTCIPAGSQILTAAHIICPRHNDSGKTDAHVNVNWCFICVGGGQVVCCETCPTAVHAKCLNIPLDPSEGYICEECESGRLPLYGEMVWAKFNSFRWWPAIILPPTEIPQNIRRKSHNSNDFVVRFFGTHDHGWISRRRVYLYLEGDSSEPPKTKSSLDQSYNRGVEEAKRIYEIIKSKKLAQRLSNESKEKLHPQPYVRIKANRAVHPVKLHIDLDKVNKCECKTYDKDPCGPNSNCLNRVLYHECNPKVCPAGERCQNQMFESKLSPRLDVVYLKERGFGLVCREPISIGDFVIEYVGEIIDDNEFRQRMSQKSLDRDENFYFLSVEKDYIIDAGPKGNLARFMNHSCDPNCETQKWSVNGLNRIGLFAIKDIPADTELTFNYHWDDLLGNEKKICLCGAAKCAGEIGGKNKEEKVPKENSAVDVNKAKSSAARKRKPLKRLQNRMREGNEKRDRKKLSNNVSVKTQEKSSKANTSTKLADQQLSGNTGSDAPEEDSNIIDITANDDENGESTNLF